MFLCLIVALLARRLAGIQWTEVGNNLIHTPWYVIASVGSLTAVSYAIFCTYDWLSLRHYKKRSPLAMLYVPAFVSYAANFNFGSILGAVAMRLKLYSQLGLGSSQIAAVVAFSTIGNWMGYMLFAGAFYLAFPPTFPSEPWLASIPWRTTGALMLVFFAAVLLTLVRYGPMRFNRFHLQIPGWRDGLKRSALALLNWAAVTGLLLVIFSWHFGAPAEPVITAYLVSVIAGVLVHIPGGLGVFETVFLAALSQHLPLEQIMAGMLMFRSIFYLLPLALAVPAWIWFHYQMHAAVETHVALEEPA